MIPSAIGELLDDVARAGLELAADGDRLRYRPAAAMTAELGERVAAAKPAILDLLRQPGASVYSAAELAVLARAGLSPADVPEVGVLKAAFAAVGGLTVVEFEPMNLAAEVEALPEDWREAWEERAAIMEFDGDLPRDRAERLALADIQALKSDVNLVRRNKPADGGGARG